MKKVLIKKVSKWILSILAVMLLLVVAASAFAADKPAVKGKKSATVSKKQKVEDEDGIELVEDVDISTTILADEVEIEEEPVAITRTVSGKTSKIKTPTKKTVTFSRTSSGNQTTKKAGKKKK